MSVTTADPRPMVALGPERVRGWRSRETWARAVPAGFFVALVLIRRDTLREAVQGISTSTSVIESLESGLMLAFLMLGGAFYLLIAALFLGRYSPAAAADGLRPTLLAVAGTWGAAPLSLLPIIHSAPGRTLAANFLMVLGMAASCLALSSLGRHFGIRPRARGVVSRGLYAHIRHPLYVFEAIAQLGTLLVVLSPLAVTIFVAYLALQYARAGAEERLLARTFPAYREYQSRTWRFIPGLV